MNLLADGDWLEIRSALQDVMETFHLLPVYYVNRTTRTLAKFHESRKADLNKVTYRMNCLLVVETKDDKSKVIQTQQGFADLSEGYMNFNYKMLKEYTPSFIDIYGKPTFVPNKDTFVIFGEEVSIIGVNVVGNTQQDFQLVRVQFKKTLVNNDPVPLPNTVLEVPVLEVTLSAADISNSTDSSTLTLPAVVG